MGQRKKLAADKRKQERKNICIAILRDHPSSPRKMRLVVDLVRGMNVLKALSVLKFTNRAAAKPLYKLILSAVANWNVKFPHLDIEESEVFIQTIMVSPGSALKRIRPAPQGRAHRIRKRSNHVTVILDAKNKEVAAPVQVVETPTVEA